MSSQPKNAYEKIIMNILKGKYVNEVGDSSFMRDVGVAFCELSNPCFVDWYENAFSCVDHSKGLDLALVLDIFVDNRNFYYENNEY